jgi:hypothetical protein
MKTEVTDILKRSLLMADKKYVKKGFLVFDAIEIKQTHTTWTVTFLKGNKELASLEATKITSLDTLSFGLTEGRCKISLGD